MDCRIPNTEPELSESLYVVASSEVREVTRVQYWGPSFARPDLLRPSPDWDNLS